MRWITGCAGGHFSGTPYGLTSGRLRCRTSGELYGGAAVGTRAWGRAPGPAVTGCWQPAALIASASSSTVRGKPAPRIRRDTRAAAVGNRRKSLLRTDRAIDRMVIQERSSSQSPLVSQD